VYCSPPFGEPTFTVTCWLCCWMLKSQSLSSLASVMPERSLATTRILPCPVGVLGTFQANACAKPGSSPEMFENVCPPSVDRRTTCEPGFNSGLVCHWIVTC
jgi:hypothetical protein